MMPSRIIAVCGALVDNAKTAKPDRVKALVARAGAYDRKDMLDNAIGDYDAALRLDPTLADVFNTRGELWRRKGDRRRALADFAAAIKLNPDHPTAKANYKSLAQELERLGAQMAVAGKPSFNCATARRRGGKGHMRQSGIGRSRPRDQRHVHHRGPRGRGRLCAHEASLAARSGDVFWPSAMREFGRPGYDLRKAMKARLRQIVGADGF